MPTKGEAAALAYDPGVFDAAEYMSLPASVRMARGFWADAERHQYEDEVEFTRRSFRRHRKRRK